MKELRSIYIERNNCEDCYRCLRECAVKAIKCDGNGVTIDYERCVECGECVAKCKNNYIKMRDDVYLARQLMRSRPVKIASISPLWEVEFEGISVSRFVEALKLLGFTNVSEAALGAEAIMDYEAELLQSQEGLSITSRCPAVIDYIHKFKPKLAASILSVASPMMTHVRMIRSWWGENATVVHISSCVAAKSEAERNSDMIDLALTFAELKRWLNDEGIGFDKISGNDSYTFEPATAKEGLLYTLEGGSARMITERGCDVSTISKSSMDQVKSLLHIIPERENDQRVLLDLMACKDGCQGCCGSTPTLVKQSPVNIRIKLEKIAKQRKKIADNYILPPVSVKRTMDSVESISSFVAESDTLKALDSLGIAIEAQQIDCNACGYVKCRRFAKALSRGIVRREMCTHFMLVDLKSKFSALIDRMSAGVAIVNSQMTIVEANRQLALMLGLDVELRYDAIPGLRGVAATDVLPFTKYISTVIESGEDSLVRDVQVKERIITVSIHTIQRNKMVLVLCRNMLFSQVRNEEIVARTKRVVKENLETVQKIALLLGENASRTEAILNSILDSQTPENCD